MRPEPPATQSPTGIAKTRIKNTLVSLSAAAVCSLSAAASLAAANAQLDTDRLVDLSFDELLGIEITSVSKKTEKLRDAAAIFVVTGEDLRRSGARRIPDALRMVPGVQVGQTHSNRWAITARGNNSRRANKRLIPMDGRSVLSPVYAGVYWESRDTFLEDIDRIEVIRGPAATLWGANAVKAAYVYNFVKFADWPAGVLCQSAPHLTLCTDAGDGLREVLDTLNGKPAKDMTLQVADLPGSGLAGCQVVLIEQRGNAERLRTDQPVLTIHSLDDGYRMLRLLREGNRMRFAINLAAARSGSIKLSSKLTGVAADVLQHDNGGPHAQ